MENQPSIRMPSTWEANLSAAGLLIWIVLVSGILALFLNIGLLMLAGQVLFIVPVLVWVIIRRLPLRDTFRLKPVSMGTAVGSILIGFTCWPIVAAAVTLLEKPLNLIGPYPPSPVPAGVLESVLYALTFIVVAPLTEEPIYRGFILRAWLRRGTLAGILLSGFLFGLVHSQIAALLPITFLGIVLGMLSHRSGSIVNTILAHAAYNILPTFFYLIPSLQNIPDGMLYTAGIIALPILGLLLSVFLRTHPDRSAENPPRESSSLLWPIVTLGIAIGLFCMMAGLEIFLRLSPDLVEGKF
jgi:membrane protease YdiL (CAAX protease family)